MRLLFLDIDGVLNSHDKLKSGYCGIDRDKADNLNEILSVVPDLKIVISSAWRYVIIRGDMTLNGFEYLLMTNGVDCQNKLHGHTDEDENLFDGMGKFDPHHFDVKKWEKIGLTYRSKQIKKYVERHSIVKFAVLDDLELNVPNFVRTDGAIGLTKSNADMVIGILQ